ncbi:hypothetical protein FBU59_006559 [Linderina macrospora]|uniref:Uncharacterized protein n=1 Tax=Linderina macrospora TaxID=4868 RepID=A0ACC1IZI8_9FUNG|nr:hypothetical protein FBU59_006559 [Linderina macrospora]
MLKWFKTVRQQLRRSGLTPADPSTATYHESAPVVVSDNSAGVSSAPSRLVSRINTADNTRTHTRNPTLSLDNVPAVTVSPAPGSVASSVHVPSSDDNDDGSGDDDQGGYVSDASSETTEQSSLNPSMVSVHDPLISLDSYAAEHTMTPDFLTADTPDDSSPYTWGPAVADLPTCPAGCGCNCLYETRSVM